MKLVQKVILPAKEKFGKINFLLIGVLSFLNCFSDFLNVENNEFIFSSLEDFQNTGIVGSWDGIKIMLINNASSGYALAIPDISNVEFTIFNSKVWNFFYLKNMKSVVKTYETHSLLTGAYRGKRILNRIVHTHSVCLKNGKFDAVLCGTVKLASVADCEDDGIDLIPLCPKCAKKDPRFKNKG